MAVENPDQLRRGRKRPCSSVMARSVPLNRLNQNDAAQAATQSPARERGVRLANVHDVDGGFAPTATRGLKPAALSAVASSPVRGTAE